MKEEVEQKIHEFAVNAEVLYKAGYEDGYKAGYEGKCLLTDEECLADQRRQYEKGLNDAWECIRKLEDISNQAVMNIFHFGSIYKIAKNYTATEIITKIKEYEEKQKQTDDEIKVGDGVVSAFGKHGYVTGMDKDELYVLYPNGEVGHSSTNTYAKDGRYFSRMAEILKQMEGEND